MNNWIEVSEQRLSGNLHAIRDVVGPQTTVLAVIKANAYGHGAEACAPMLVRAGATWLGVTSAHEGARVRCALTAAGLIGDRAPDLLIMSGFLPEDVPLIHRHTLIPVVWTPDHIAALPPRTRVHVEVDTGMGRQGTATLAELDTLLARIAAARLLLDGLFTHFCSSEVAHAPITGVQQQRFTAILQHLAEDRFTIPWLHTANTSAVDNPAPPQDWLAQLARPLQARMLARTGLALYGYCLPLEGIGPSRLQPLLQPVLTWKARVLSVRTLAPGETVGYNATFTATQPMRIALLPVGYADGLRRELSSSTTTSGGWAILHGEMAPILGRISMNLTVVDITHIPDVHPHDEAILLGPGITAEDHAALAQTIPYEILCGLHPCG